MVPRPWVTQRRGTSSIVEKKRALSSRVCAVSVATRVRDENEENGSLKPMWPLEPMPRIWTSTPPTISIAASYSSAAACGSAAAPSGTRTRSGSILNGTVTVRLITLA